MPTTTEKRVRERSAEEIAARKAKKQNKRARLAVPAVVALEEFVSIQQVERKFVDTVALAEAVRKARLSSKEKAPEQAAKIQGLANSLGGSAELKIAAYSYARARRAKPWPVLLRALQRAAALDSLHWELWATAKTAERDGEGTAGKLVKDSILHPAALAEEAASAAIECLGSSEPLRRALLQMRAVALRWGFCKAWLSGRSRKMWRPGACPLLRLLRARWCEGACYAAGKLADSHTRAGLLRWQFVGRDGAARWLSFAVPGAIALRALVAFVGNDGVVELGAHNGYWAARLGSLGVKVLALDIAPPPHAPAVVYGTASQLQKVSHGTLLLCMPPPGEAGCAEHALEAFSGDRVAYVGEWGTGMTGTREFHHQILQRFELERKVPLPCWALMRVELFLFRRRTRPVSMRAAASSSPLTCDACGKRGSELWRCPWTRQVRVCSESCFLAASAEHRAALAACFCGGDIAESPVFSAWELCGWLEHGVASERQWDALREATPQAEVGKGKGVVRVRE